MGRGRKGVSEIRRKTRNHRILDAKREFGEGTSDCWLVLHHQEAKQRAEKGLGAATSFGNTGPRWPGGQKWRWSRVLNERQRSRDSKRG